MTNSYIKSLLKLLIVLKKYISIFGFNSTSPFLYRLFIKIIPKRYHENLSNKFLSLGDSSFYKSYNRVNKYLIYPKNFQKSILKHEKIKDDILLSAEMILSGKFNFLGFKDTILDSEKKWEKDFNTGFSWGKKFYTHYEQSDLFIDGGTDIKIPWELNRMHHLTVLGQAWCLTDNITYVNRIHFEWDDWINKNPFCYGINWISTMEVSIRAINFIVVCELISDSNIWKDNKGYFLNNIRQHGIYIENNLEIGVNNLNIIAGNHYLANICALYIIGRACPQFPESKRWAVIGKRELEKEINRTVLNDGFYFESSTAYHRFAIELFLYPYLVGLNSEDQFSKNYLKKIKDMLRFLESILTPDGTTPQIGDNDNGRLLILSNYYNSLLNDHRYLLSIGTIIFKETKMSNFIENSFGEIFWLFDDNLDLSKFKKQNNYTNEYLFDNSGLRLMKNNDSSDYLLIRAVGPSSKSLTSHCHNDQLSFELWLDNKAIIVDNGTGCYTKSLSLRNQFRSTKMHNAVMINNKEINSIDDADYFSLFSNSFSKILSHKIKPHYNEIYCVREDDFKDEFLSAHHRSFKYIKNDKLIINDKITSKGEFNASSYLHFHPLLNPKLVYDNNSYFIKGIKNLIIKIIDESNSIENINISSSSFSESYGYIERSKKLKIDIKGFNKAKMKIFFIHEN